MKYEELQKLNKIISNAREPGERQFLQPIINVLCPSQRNLIISSDPSSDTDKSGNPLDKHSSFEERILALMFYGNDEKESVSRINVFYKDFKEIFLNNFYWTHYSKVYAKGSPGPFWANRFLREEIELFEPKLIIIFGGIVTKFLFNSGKFIDYVNKVSNWNNIPTICCLHPSRDWNIFRRDQYKFHETWDLIRDNYIIYKEDQDRVKILQELVNSDNGR